MNYLYQQLLKLGHVQNLNAQYDYSADLWMSYGQEDEHKETQTPSEDALN